MNTHEKDILPVLALKDVIFMPESIVSIFVGRPKTLNAVRNAVNTNRDILLVLQKDSGGDEDASPGSLHEVGVIAEITQFITLPEQHMKINFHTKGVARIDEAWEEDGMIVARQSPLGGEVLGDPEENTLVDLLRTEFADFISSMGDEAGQNMVNLSQSLEQEDDPSRLTFIIASSILHPLKERQALIEEGSVKGRMRMLIQFIIALKEERKAKIDVRERLVSQMNQNQRTHYLNEQMKAIQQELNKGEGTDEFEELEERINASGMTEEALGKARSELQRLRAMPQSSHEYSMSRTYLDWLLDLPWTKQETDRPSASEAQERLDAGHFGLAKVKDRILEHIVVQSRSDKVKGPILCLVGPPGVGKTSLGKSMADAMGRSFVRVSLGGVHDESEIRGHRKTYVGAMPGKIINAMKKAGSVDPVILLDEIDKVGTSHRGDVSAALLEVLDPEQNKDFTDHYLNVGYDLSRAIFITTANSYDIPGPLMDRMEVIQLSGYTEDEKVRIAKDHLIAKQREENSVEEGEVALTDEALRHIIRYYTREAGVRNLERTIGQLMRKAITEMEKGAFAAHGPVSITGDVVEKYLGPRKHSYGLAEQKDQVGFVNGLAWTSVGGDILHIETLKLPGTGKVKATGKLGDVMKESIEAAFSYVKAIAPEMGIRPPEFKKRDLHIHLPEGAIPKDGPSAGLAMVTAMVSAMTGIPVRKDIAMTGEVTLRGNALRIGGLKEKLLAALRGGIKTVLIPRENERDLVEMPENILKGINIIPVDDVRQVLSHALTSVPEAILWDEAHEEAEEERLRSVKH